MNDYVCTICKDRGLVKAGPKASKKCQCAIVKQIRKYLTPTYAQTTIDFDLNLRGVDKFEGKDAFFVITKDKFTIFVKSFLLLTRMKYSHFTTTAFQCVLAWVESPSASHSLRDVYLPDYLFLILDTDPVNSKYDDLLCSILKKRKMDGKCTWIYSTRDCEDPQFKELYGENLSTHILESKFERIISAKEKS